MKRRSRICGKREGGAKVTCNLKIPVKSGIKYKDWQNLLRAVMSSGEQWQLNVANNTRDKALRSPIQICPLILSALALCAIRTCLSVRQVKREKKICLYKRVVCGRPVKCLGRLSEDKKRGPWVCITCMDPSSYIEWTGGNHVQCNRRNTSVISPSRRRAG